MATFSRRETKKLAQIRKNVVVFIVSVLMFGA